VSTNDTTSPYSFSKQFFNKGDNFVVGLPWVTDKLSDTVFQFRTLDKKAMDIYRAVMMFVDDDFDLKSELQ
jgi:hypothetical protein